MSSDKSHAVTFVDFNFRILLGEIPAGKDFYLSGNGRLVTPSATGTLLRDHAL